MRFGVFGASPPAGVEPDRALDWAVEHAIALGVQVVGGDGRAMFGGDAMHIDAGRWRDLRERAAVRDLAIEPFVRSPFDLVEAGAAARRALVDSIASARNLGGPVMRTAYGDQTLARTRFGSGDLGEHLRRLESNLRQAAEIADAEGVVLAIENHTDFSGREWDSVFERLGSPAVACAFDCANGLTVFADPLDDAQHLARWAVTTHLKDLKVIENPRPPAGASPQVPFGLIGCPIGDGAVDVRRAVELLLAESPAGADIPLIVEPSWPEGTGDLAALRNELLAENLRRLRNLVEELR